MELSIIICTYNRCESLKDTLMSILQQEFCENFGYEIIIVDNNSTDETKNAVESFIPYFNNKLHYTFEDSQGISYARNRGLLEAKGNIIAFTDDDCVADKRWISNINEIMANKEIKCITGKIIPIWTSSPPSWFSKSIRTALPDIDEGETTKVINNATGANMIFKREVFEKVGNFDTSYQAADDTIFSLKINKTYTIWYYPSLKVFHKIGSERITKKYFREWYWRSGKSIATIESKFRLPNRTFLRIPFWTLKNFVKDCILYLKNIFREKSKFYHELQIYRFFSYSYHKWKNK